MPWHSSNGDAARCAGSHTRLRSTAAALIGACAAYQVMLGSYFVAFRPPLLPEDLRFLGTTAERLVVDLPRLERWLDLVFAVLGGQMAALGLLLGAFSMRWMRRRAIDRLELGLLGGAGILSVAMMSAVNFALESDFRWLLVFPVLAWAMGVALAALEIAAAPAEAGEHPHAG